MLRNHLKIGIRAVVKSKGYSFISVFGLALGIACCLLMFNYVQFETSFDDFHPNVGRTFRVDQRMPFRADDQVISSTAPPLAYTLKSMYPEVEATLRINTPGDFIVRYEDKPGHLLSFQENRVFAADATFFSFFGFVLKEGDATTALHGVNKVVISDAIARKFFGDGPALGKFLEFGDDRKPVEVTGVTMAQPPNTHFHFDYLLSMETNPNVARRDWSWVWTQVVTYVRLREGASPEQLENKLADLGEQVIRPAFESRSMDFDNGGERKTNWNFFLRPMRELHLKTGDNRLGPVGNINYVYTFAVTGIFVLVIAAINFINLATARATRRAKEVGVKKALGASRGTLISQFQTESVFLSFLAMAFALLLTDAMQRIITTSIGIEMPLNIWNQPSLLIVIPFLPVLIGFLAGIYPSLYLTAFRPVQVLKGKLAMGMGNTQLRNTLVVAQFTISIALIAGTLIVFQQLRFLSSANLGFNKENILLVKYAHKLGTHLQSFRDELRALPGVDDVGITMEVPGAGTWTDGMTREGSDVNVPIALVKIDDNYFRTLNFKLVAGRLFDEARPADKNAVIPNETAIRQLGWTPEEALGKFIIYPGNNNSRHEVIGVMQDSHYQSLHQAIFPIIFCQLGSDLWGDWFVMTVKFQSSKIKELLTDVEAKWKAAVSDTPFAYSFLDHDLAQQYKAESQLGKLFSVFSGLAILIGVIGLTGLVAYSAETRKKEIGIRKVFGASASRIVVMMNSQYLRLMGVALLLSIAPTWWLMARWLDSFAYRIEISPATFIVAGLCQVLISLIMVGHLSLRAALLNPSKVLRDE